MDPYVTLVNRYSEVGATAGCEDDVAWLTSWSAALWEIYSFCEAMSLFCNPRHRSASSSFSCCSKKRYGCPVRFLWLGPSDLMVWQVKQKRALARRFWRPAILEARDSGRSSSAGGGPSSSRPSRADIAICNECEMIRLTHGEPVCFRRTAYIFEPAIINPMSSYNADSQTDAVYEIHRVAILSQHSMTDIALRR